MIGGVVSLLAGLCFGALGLSRGWKLREVLTLEAGVILAAVMVARWHL